MAVATPMGGSHPGFDGSEDEFCAMVEEVVG